MRVIMFCFAQTESIVALRVHRVTHHAVKTWCIYCAERNYNSKENISQVDRVNECDALYCGYIYITVGEVAYHIVLGCRSSQFDKNRLHSYKLH